jgi:hypothetical protein
MTERVIYESSNGDVWVLARDPASEMPTVKHQPNASAGGPTSYTDIGKFLRVGAGGPEHQALLSLSAPYSTTKAIRLTTCLLRAGPRRR